MIVEDMMFDSTIVPSWAYSYIPSQDLSLLELECVNQTAAVRTLVRV